jgi:hypothetical protein
MSPTRRKSPSWSFWPALLTVIVTTPPVRVGGTSKEYSVAVTVNRPATWPPAIDGPAGSATPPSSSEEPQPTSVGTARAAVRTTVVHLPPMASSPPPAFGTIAGGQPMGSLVGPTSHPAAPPAP